MPTFARTITPIAIAVLTLASPALFGQDRVEDLAAALTPAPIETDARIVTGRLENGLRYIVAPSGSPDAGAGVALVIDAGAVHEPPAPAGTAVLASRLVFGDSASFAPSEMEALFRRAGVSIDRRDNIANFFDSTVYQLELLESDDESLALALRVFADVARGVEGIDFDERLIEQERSLAQRDLKASLDLNTRVNLALIPRLFPATAYADHPPSGTDEGLALVTVDDLRGYVSRSFTPERMTVVVAGAYDAGAVVESIQQRFAGIKGVAENARPEVRAIRRAVEPAPIILTDPEIPAANVHLMCLLPERSGEATVQDLERSLARDVAMTALRQRVEGLACNDASVYGSLSLVAAICQSVTQLSLVAAVEPSSWRETLESIASTLRVAHEHGFTAVEVNTAKKTVLSMLERNARGVSLDRPVEASRELALRSAFGSAPILTSHRADLARVALRTLDAPEINRAFRESFDPAHALTLLLFPDDFAPPSEDEVAQAFRTEIDGTARRDAPPLVIAPLPEHTGTVERLEVHSMTGALSAWLGNNVRVHHLRRDDMEGRVRVSLTLAGGRIDEDEHSRGLTLATSAFWESPSTSQLAACDTRAILDRLAIEWSHSIEQDHVRLSADAPKENADAALRLMAAALHDPSLEPRALENWRAKSIVRRDYRRTVPRAMLNEAILDALHRPDDPRHRDLSDEEIRAVDKDAAARWLRDLASAGPIELAIVGDISRRDALDLCARTLGALPERERIDGRTSDPKRLLRMREHPTETHIRIESMADRAVALIGFRGPGSARMDDRRNLDVAMRVLAARLDAQLANTDRAEESGVIRVAANAYANDAYPDFGLAYAYAEVEPAKRNGALLAIEHEFATLAYEGPTEEEVRLARLDAMNDLERTHADPAWWADCLSATTYRGLGVDAPALEREALEAVTAQSVLETLGVYHDSSRKITVTITPERPTQSAK